MSRLLLANIDPETSDEEIDAFLEKYGFPPYSDIERMEGDGSRPSALVSFDDCTHEVLEELKDRINEIQWKDRKLTVQVLSDRFS